MLLPGVSDTMRPYRWTRKLVIYVLKDIIRRTRENRRRPLNKELAILGMPRKKGRPSKTRTTNHSTRDKDIRIPIAPSPAPSSCDEDIHCPLAPTNDDSDIPRPTSTAEAGLVKGSIATRRKDRAQIDAEIPHPPSTRHAGAKKQTVTKISPPSHAGKQSQPQSKLAARPVHSKPIAASTKDNTASQDATSIAEAPLLSSKPAFRIVEGLTATVPTAEDGIGYRARIVGNVAVLPLNLSMQQWMSIVDRHIRIHRPEAYIGNNGSGYRYYLVTGEDSYREVCIARDLDLVDDYNLFLERVRRGKVVVDLEELCLDLEKVDNSTSISRWSFISLFAEY
jgi:hypothetical protein